MTKAKINLEELVEHAIIGKLVDALIADGYRVQLSDQDGGGLFLYAMPDGKEFPREPNGVNHFVRLTPGNGADVLTDYSTNLESLVAPINDFADLFRD